MTFGGDCVVKVIDPVVFPERFFVTVIKNNVYEGQRMYSLARELFRYDDESPLRVSGMESTLGITVVDRVDMASMPDLG